MKPNKNNYCGGNFTDWLEVMLLPECNANCSWCVEKKGWHPIKRVDWKSIADAAIDSGKTNIILLGGEPTLYKDLQNIITYLYENGKNVYLTTNGSMLTPEYIMSNLKHLKGINISVHHYNVNKNKEITGILLPFNIDLSVDILKIGGTHVRFNCNLIKGYIDSKDEILECIRQFKALGADSIRFAELKFDNENFINLAKVFDYQFGLNDEPYTCGCNINTVIDGVDINFRQMCGIQTTMRPQIDNPEQERERTVLYYDGKIYDGWQLKRGEDFYMTGKDLVKLLDQVKKGKTSVADAAEILIDIVDSSSRDTYSGGGCRY